MLWYLLWAIIPLACLAFAAPLLFRALEPERQAEVRGTVRRGFIRMGLATLAVVAAGVAWYLLDREAIDAGQRKSLLSPLVFAVFHLLWWPFAMPVITALDRANRDRPETPGRSGEVRVASLRPRLVSSYLSSFARALPPLLGLAAPAVLVWRSLAVDAGGGVIAFASVFALGGYSFLITYGFWARREVTGPQQLADLGDGSERYEREVERLRRFRVRGVYAMQVSAAAVFFGCAALSIDASAGRIDGRVLGLVGGILGSAIGVAGGVFGTLASVYAFRLARLKRDLLVAAILLVGLALPAYAGSDYVVLVDPGEDDAYRPAAEALAKLHDGLVRPFDPADLDGALEALRRSPPRHVAFVLPPEKIDVELCHALLAMATKVDEDPFIDFAFGFVTGLDGSAALRFVGRIEAAAKRKFGRQSALFGTWEGFMLPSPRPLTALKTLGFESEMKLVWTKAKEPDRRKAAKAALQSFTEKDALLFFSHGYPDRMVGCYTAADLREWKVRFAPALLINCSCYNGAPGRWFDFGPGGRFKDAGRIDPAASVALQILNSGIGAYISGIDPWHGPLAFQVFQHIADDGLSLGAATKAMYDRLALAFLPERIAYPPTGTVVMTGEGRANRLRNGAGMILYGDPAFAPFGDEPARRFFARWEGGADGRTLVMGFRPLIEGQPGQDFMLSQARLMDYYSVRTRNILAELKMEIYRVVPLPDGVETAPKLRVAKAVCGDGTVKTGDPQVVVEETLDGRRLHVRVPILEPLFPAIRLLELAKKGVTVELAEVR